ncbi:CAP-Gly domain protein [Onchocerca flexuosa]|uniref:CAP-Gly domain protein n=1 Tax=Onchocerca flexuosa TaxID=387005 RepID=A0A238BSU7_9BILA|nr:CAP-Gly domain protein [Onchocerca flexuosa]
MAAKVFSLTITSNLRQYPYEKRYPASMTLHELKEKLQLVVGSSAECMRTELHDKDGKFISSLTDDQATLEKLGVTDGMPTYTLLEFLSIRQENFSFCLHTLLVKKIFFRFLIIFSGMKIHVSDTSVENPVSYENVATVGKYTISEEKYDEREDSVRAWKRREGLKIQYDALAGTENEAKQFKERKVGDRCTVHASNQQEKRGVISYIGRTKFKDGYWIGVAYDEPFGKHDGSVDGERYFTCENKHGVFVRPREVKKCEQDEEMEEI